MIHNNRIGRSAMVWAIIIFIVADIFAYMNYAPAAIPAEKGICFPSPNLWFANHTVSWAVNSLAILICALFASVLNKHYNIIPTPEPSISAFFLIIMAGLPLFNSGFSASAVICITNMLAMSLMFKDYRSRNATQHLFVVATMLSVGTMVQYAFGIFILAWIGAMLLLEVFRFKEFVAFLLGLIAPYWVVIGLGIAPLSEFKIPQFVTIFAENVTTSDLLFLYINLGITALLALIAGLNNSLKLFAGNKKTHTLNSVINVIGLTALVGMVVDYSNMSAYITTFYFVTALQCANICALGIIKMPRLFFGTVSTLYVALFILQII